MPQIVLCSLAQVHGSSHVAWTLVSGLDVPGLITLSYDSPYLPIYGYATSLDDYTWSDGGSAGVAGGNGLDNGVVVPNEPPVTPDGGLTVTLLGGALLGLGALRRKLGC